MGAALTVKPRNRIEIGFCTFCISDRIPDCGFPLSKDSILELLDQHLDVVLSIEPEISCSWHRGFVIGSCCILLLLLHCGKNAFLIPDHASSSSSSTNLKSSTSTNMKSSQVVRPSDLSTTTPLTRGKSLGIYCRQVISQHQEIQSGPCLRDSEIFRPDARSKARPYTVAVGLHSDIVISEQINQHWHI